ncbi:MAG: hypothetical protein A2161_16950 [Candidatus Schekmanbacteria bacterium RBG_13_48_7]|uniref:Uncharacterized protein n=1 Tax=Candidatus Schekmanbacteria bacterium RBG_13_48_7 TaxID=1817878 RepID=A0A1F7RRC8_9BACT|nr:MAG: hypothetical protein A2161_16950 [Candidatus Schekmanbacteria bacterium RBG_13_48_7]
MKIANDDRKSKLSEEIVKRFPQTSDFVVKKFIEVMNNRTLEDLEKLFNRQPVTVAAQTGHTHAHEKSPVTPGQAYDTTKNTLQQGKISVLNPSSEPELPDTFADLFKSESDTGPTLQTQSQHKQEKISQHVSDSVSNEEHDDPFSFEDNNKQITQSSVKMEKIETRIVNTEIPSNEKDENPLFSNVTDNQIAMPVNTKGCSPDHQQEIPDSSDDPFSFNAETNDNQLANAEQICPSCGAPEIYKEHCRVCGANVNDVFPKKAANE